MSDEEIILLKNSQRLPVHHKFSFISFPYPSPSSFRISIVSSALFFLFFFYFYLNRIKKFSVTFYHLKHFLFILFYFACFMYQFMSILLTVDSSSTVWLCYLFLYFFPVLWFYNFFRVFRVVRVENFFCFPFLIFFLDFTLTPISFFFF